MQHTASKNDFGKGSISRTILTLAIPMTIAQLTAVLYNMVDRAFIGHIENIGTAAFTGMGLVMPFTYIITAFANLGGTGGAPLFSMARGNRDYDYASRVMGNAFCFLIILGTFMMTVSYLFLEPILYLVGGSPETVPFAIDYMKIYLLGTLPTMISLGMNPFINAQGFGKTGMMTVMLGAIINLVLDPLFIFVLDMGVRGAALTTVIAQTISATWVIFFLTGKKAILRLELRILRPQLFIIKRISALGLTGFTFSVTNSLVHSVGNSLLQTYGGAQLGDLYVGSMTAICSIREVITQPRSSLTQAAQMVMSFNYGAGKYSRVRECIKFLIKSTLLYCGCVWILLLTFPRAFILVFNNDPALLEIAPTCLQIFFAAYVMMGFQGIGQNTYVALGYAKRAVFFSLFRKVILVLPMMLTLPRLWNLGAYGVFVSEPISDLIGGLACFTTMMFTVWKQMQQPDRLEPQS